MNFFLIRNVFKDAKTRNPSFFRKCPLIGEASMINYSLDKSLINMIPLGTYIVRNKIYDNQTSKKRLILEMFGNFSLTG